MKIIKNLIFCFIFIFTSSLNANEIEFNNWLLNFKKKALNEGISEKTFNMTMNKAKYIPKVIEYDRFQPEFYEDTKTYITKRANKNKIKKGIQTYSKNSSLIDKVEKEFYVEKAYQNNLELYNNKGELLDSNLTLEKA